MRHFLRFSTMLSILLSVAAFGLLHTPSAAAYYSVDDWSYEPVKRYENYDYNKVIYDSPEEYWIRTSPYASTTHALHPYWRQNYSEYRPYTPSLIRSERFGNYLLDAYERGYLGSLYSAQPLDLPRGPSLQSRCMNYTVRSRAGRMSGIVENCDERRSGIAPSSTMYDRYDYGY